MRKKVSVIMPVCNETEYFAEAVQSILAQTYDNFELLVIDGSDDKDKVLGLLPSDSRIRLLYREKRGICDALNYGILQAQGEYIARMDADDISLKQRLEKQVDFLNNNPDIDVVGSWFGITKEDGTLIAEKRPPVTHEQIVANMLFENPVCHPSVMIRKKVFDEGVRYPDTAAEDYALWTSMIPKYRFANLPESLLLWRRHGKAASKRMADNVHDSDIGSAAGFVCRIFGIEMREFENGMDLLTKNYARKKLQDTYRKKGADFVAEEYLFLNSLKRKCPLWIKDEVDYEIKKRWEILLKIIGCFTLETRQLLTYPWTDESVIEDDGMAENIRKAIEKNEMRRRELLGAELSVVFYGMGEEGVQALEAYEEAVNAGHTCWTIAGLIDRDVRSVEINGMEHVVSGYEKLKGLSPDAIVVTTSNYYGEIEKKLIGDGFAPEGIMGDSILHCICENMHTEAARVRKTGGRNHDYNEDPV